MLLDYLLAAVKYQSEGMISAEAGPLFVSLSMVVIIDDLYDLSLPKGPQGSQEVLL